MIRSLRLSRLEIYFELSSISSTPPWPSGRNPLDPSFLKAYRNRLNKPMVCFFFCLFFLDAQVIHIDASRPRNSRLPSRKEARKLERIAQKQRKAAHFSQASNGRKRPADGEHFQSPQRKRSRLDDSTSGSRSRQASASTPIQNYEKVPVPSSSGSKPSSKHSGPLKKKASKTEREEKAPSIPVAKSAVEEEEDAYIAYLEGKLGMGKGKKKAKAFEEDGLDG